MLDAVLPGTADLLGDVQSDPRLGDLRVLPLVPLGLEAPALVGRRAGASLNKPVCPMELRQRLLESLREEVPAASPAPESIGAGVPQGRVLVAEDNPVNALGIQAVLENLGCQAKVVSDGRQAVEELRRQSFDLVLMDCQMPELDGFKATEELRRREQTEHLPRVPVVALTAYAMQGDRERCLSAGMDDYLSKPVNQGQIADVLRRWVGTRRSA
jgi:CheY-like chemotaxis protein